jgi:hypothetical protein
MGSCSLYLYQEDFGRDGWLDGLFVADDNEVASAMGRGAYFGDVLGKHSDIVARVDDVTIERINASPEFVAEFERIFEDGIGYNPVNVVRTQFEDDEEYDG